MVVWLGLVGWLVGCLVAWLIARLVARLVAWLRFDCEWGDTIEERSYKRWGSLEGSSLESCLELAIWNYQRFN